ncbi:DUF5412 domain-containing protein [Bacillus sp. BC1-43]|nr:DUF5412 domain-containing protein [Bacillus sp. BC1-43]
MSSYHCFIEVILKKCKDYMNPIYSKMREKKGESHIKTENTLSLDAARGELVNEKTLVKRTIYWNYPDSRPAVTWINHNTVKIGNQTLHLDTDETYDWRKDDHWIREEPPQASVR